MDDSTSNDQDPIAPETGAPTRRRSVWSLLFITVLLLPIALWMVHDEASLFRDQEAAGRDLEIRIREQLLPMIREDMAASRRAQQIVLVTIDDHDYDRLFGATSPLDVDTLQRLLNAIIRENPVAIGVDLSTSDTSFQRLQIPDEWRSRIIWSRSASTVCPCRLNGSDCGVAFPLTEPGAYRYCTERDDESVGQLVPHRFLGGAQNEHDRSALARLPLDPDSHVRRYVRMALDARTPEGETHLPMFAPALARITAASRGAERPGLESAVTESGAFDGRLRLIDYRTLRSDFEVPARDLLSRANADTGGRATILQGRIVLLGGTYWAGRDVFVTPLGELPGVAVHAHILETELSGGGKPEVDARLMLLVLVMSVAGLYLIQQRLPFETGILFSLLFYIPVVTIVASLALADSWIALAPYFLFVLGAWLINKLVDQLKPQAKVQVGGLTSGVAARFREVRLPAPRLRSRGAIIDGFARTFVEWWFVWIRRVTSQKIVSPQGSGSNPSADEATSTAVDTEE